MEYFDNYRRAREFLTLDLIDLVLTNHCDAKNTEIFYIFIFDFFCVNRGSSNTIV